MLFMCILLSWLRLATERTSPGDKEEMREVRVDYA
jgi:hypothetical protein